MNPDGQKKVSSIRLASTSSHSPRLQPCTRKKGPQAQVKEPTIFIAMQPKPEPGSFSRRSHEKRTIRLTDIAKLCDIERAYICQRRLRLPAPKGPEGLE